jgi:4-amino-4-deoxy-L-arabinose transferase-like glycosyltransferase
LTTRPPDTPHEPTRALTRKLRTPLFFLAAYAALLLLHLTLLDLPYYWDEAGYFIPAARDIYADCSFIPHSTLSNAHPPLVMTYIAVAWKLFGFHIWVARAAMTGVAALALTGVYALGCRVANARVALAAAVCTALYPVFFAQSTLAHLDMMVAALTLWALVFYLPPRDATFLQGDAKPLQGDATPLRDSATTLQTDAMSLQGGAGSLREMEMAHFRRVICVLLLALAALAKETAVLVPVVLCGWELVCWLLRRKARLAALVCIERRPAWWSLTLLLAGVPLALWFAYHRARTGYTLGNPEYFRYNVESTLSLARILDTVWRRLGHVTFHMNLWVLSLAGLAAMFLKPRRDGQVERTCIGVPVQLLFLVLVLAHVCALSVVGGAVLARYMLPVLPLVILVWVSTLWRRVPAWPLAVALVCAAFAYRAEANPAYSFPWEENLAYRDFVLLHRNAARFLEDKYPDARVLTSWPATDELRNPYYGYTTRALSVVPVENFLPAELERAAARKSEYDVALLYSSHGGLELDEAARLLDGRVVFREEHKGQWVAVVDVRDKP